MLLSGGGRILIRAEAYTNGLKLIYSDEEICLRWDDFRLYGADIKDKALRVHEISDLPAGDALRDLIGSRKGDDGTSYLAVLYDLIGPLETDDKP